MFGNMDSQKEIINTVNSNAAETAADVRETAAQDAAGQGTAFDEAAAGDRPETEAAVTETETETETETGGGTIRHEDGADEDTEEKGPGWKYYLVYFAWYTLLFGVTAAAVFVWFWLKKRRFVWKSDGANQHYYGLLFFARWGKEVLQQFRETGVFRLPTFTLRMGYGGDLFTTLAYYVIGDPFSLPAVFVPEKYLLAFHDLMLLVRFWLAGITFSAYNFYMGRKSRVAVLAGALVYVFNGFTLSGMRHHYFLNPFVFFPLLLIGCERIFRKKKPGLFVFMVFLCAVSNFYFFYMMVLMTVLYAVWRSVWMRGLRQFGRVLLDGLSFVWYGLLGTLLAAFVFLPVVLRFLEDPRAADDKTIPLLWPVKYYQNFLDSFLSKGTSEMADSWTYMGFGAVAALCVLFIFARWKKHRGQKAAFAVLTALLLTPMGGFVLNGFSYPANRWMWAYALLIGTMTATAVSEIAEAGVRQVLGSILLLAFVAAACVGWHYTFSRESALAVIIALFAVAAVLVLRIMMLERGQNSFGRFSYAFRVQAALLVSVLVTIVAAGYFNFAPSARAGVLEYLSRAQIELKSSKDSAAAADLLGSGLSAEGRSALSAAIGKETDGSEVSESPASADGQTGPFYRYTTFNPANNTSILYGVSTTQYYWSLSNGNVSRFLSETGQLNSMIDQYDTLDDRTALNELVGIRYFLSDTPEGVPFGYEKVDGLSYSNADLWPAVDSVKRYSCEVYENKYTLPFGFTTDRWMSMAEYNTLDIPQRQQALLQGVVLEQDPGEEYTELVPAGSSREGEAGTVQTAFSEQWMPAEIEYDEEIITEADLETDDGTPLRFEAAEGGGSVTFYFAGLPDCETYLYVRGLHYTPPAGREGAPKLLMSVKGFSGEKKCGAKQIGYTTERDPWATGRTDFLVNLQYRPEALDSISLSLPAAGTYTFDSLEVVCQPMDAYPAMAEALRAQAMTDLDIHEMGDSCATDRITGRVTLDAPRLLCLQIPKTAGWTAYVDGQRTELMQADTMFSALPLTAGTHEIEMRYQTPGLHIGAFISAGTLLLLILFTVVYAIVSAILHAIDRRREDLPEGSYESLAEEINEAAGEVTEASEEEADAKTGETLVEPLEDAEAGPGDAAEEPAEEETAGADECL